MTTFPLFNEKLLADDVHILSWCPTADLVLLVSPTNSISLYRHGVDLIWSLEGKIRSHINIVTWKPNGKEVILGCESGMFYKVDISCHSPHVAEYAVDKKPSPISTFSWLDYETKKTPMIIEGFDPNAFDIEIHLPRLSEEPPIEPLSRMPMRKKKSILPPKPLQNTEKQTLLFVGNKRGELHIFLNGIYPVGFINVCEDVSIVSTSVIENTTLLQILARPVDSNDKYVLYFLDTQYLELRKKEICSISEIRTELNYLLQYATCTIDVLKRHYDSYSKLKQNIINEAHKYIAEHNAMSMPEVELLGTLATGNISEPIHELFVDYLTSQCIKKWDTNANHGYENSQAVLSEHILPACERIQLALSKLLGYSLWTQRYGEFLDVQDVRKCIDCIQTLIVRLHHFSKSLGSVIKCFSAFIKWITIHSNKVYSASSENAEETESHPTLCDEPELVGAYLNTDFTQDSLAEYFLTQTDQGPSRNILEALENLTRSCGKMLEKPSRTVSIKMHSTFDLNFNLGGADKQPRNRIVSINLVEEKSIVYAFVKFDPDQKLLLLKKSFDQHQPLKYAQFDIDGHITDFEFFDEKELAIVIQKDKVTSTLQTLVINAVEFRDFVENEFVSDKFLPSRIRTLDKMIGVKIGCNGLPRRRLFGLAASNGQLKVHFMSDDEDDMDEDD